MADESDVFFQWGDLSFSADQIIWEWVWKGVGPEASVESSPSSPGSIRVLLQEQRLRWGETTMSTWGPVVVSRGPGVVAACEGQRKVGEGGAGLIARLEDLWQWVGGFWASRGLWGGFAGVHSTSHDEFGFHSQLWHQRANKFQLGVGGCSCEAWWRWTIPESGESP